MRKQTPQSDLILLVIVFFYFPSVLHALMIDFITFCEQATESHLVGFLKFCISSAIISTNYTAQSLSQHANFSLCLALLCLKCFQNVVRPLSTTLVIIETTFLETLIFPVVQLNLCYNHFGFSFFTPYNLLHLILISKAGNSHPNLLFLSHFRKDCP